MENDNKVWITLDQWDEYQKLKRHAKEVCITENSAEGGVVTGVSVSWKSDGKCWVYLAGKLRAYGEKQERMNEAIEELKEVKGFSVFQFLAWRKGKSGGRV